MRSGGSHSRRSLAWARWRSPFGGARSRVGQPLPPPAGVVHRPPGEVHRNPRDRGTRASVTSTRGRWLTARTARTQARWERRVEAMDRRYRRNRDTLVWGLVLMALGVTFLLTNSGRSEEHTS